MRNFLKSKLFFFSFETGELVSVESGYDHIKAASNAELSNIVPSKLDIAIIKRQEKIAPVYVWLDETSNIEKIVLPIRGYGLWGTLYGYLSLGPDLNSVMGIEYFMNTRKHLVWEVRLIIQIGNQVGRVKKSIIPKAQFLLKL